MVHLRGIFASFSAPRRRLGSPDLHDMLSTRTSGAYALSEMKSTKPCQIVTQWRDYDGRDFKRISQRKEPAITVLEFERVRPTASPAPVRYVVPTILFWRSTMQISGFRAESARGPYGERQSPHLRGVKTFNEPQGFCRASHPLSRFSIHAPSPRDSLRIVFTRR